MAVFECLAQGRFGVGESPVWDGANNRLLWSDNTSGDIHAIDLDSRARRVWRFDGRIGSLGLARSGRWVVALDNRIILFDPQGETSEPVAEVPFAEQVDKFNDGKVGPDGAFWVGSMARREPERLPVASLYRVTAAGAVEEKVAGGIFVSNGLAWSPDGRTMYHSDSRGGWIDVWDFDIATGGISNRRRLREHTPEDGAPDGAAMDVEGIYWSGGFTAQCLNRIAPDGSLVERIAVPAPATMPCFGGIDMKTLFFTSLRDHVGPEVIERYPLSGSVFMGRVDVAGLPIPLFAD